MASCVYGAGLNTVRVYAKHMHGSPKTFKWFALHELVKKKTTASILMKNAEVVAGTCAVCYDDPFENFSYDLVIVDETHLINEVGCLLPISRMKGKVILASMNVMEGMVGRLVNDKLVNPIVIEIGRAHV